MKTAQASRRRGAGGASVLLGLLATAALIGAFPRGAFSEDESAAARVDRLEKALERQQGEMESLRREVSTLRAANPAGRMSPAEAEAAVSRYVAAGPAAGFPVSAAPSGGHGVRWGGYMNMRTTFPSNAHSFFNLEKFVLFASASITDRLDLSAEIEFEDGGVTDEVQGEIELEYAEATFRCSDALNLRIGDLLVPFGRFNLYNESPLNDFTNRPFTARFLVPVAFGQPGIGLNGAVPFACGHVLSYDFALTNGYKDDFNADEGVRDARQPWDQDNNDGKQAWGRAAVTWKTSGPLDYLETGVSATTAIYDDADANRLIGYGFDLLARSGPFEVKGEYVAMDYERNASDPSDAVEGQSALWLEAAYHFMPDFWRCSRSCLLTDTSLFTLCARYQHMDLDDHVAGATFNDDLDAWSVGLNFRVTERTVFRIDNTWLEPAHGSSETELNLSFSTFF